VSQATVWRRIGALEQSLEARLFERLPSGYVLTAAGAAFLRGLDGLERAVEGACRQLTHATEAAEGEVRVAAPEFVGLMIAERLPALAKRHPRLVVELLTGSPAAALMARDVDIAIRAERLPSAGLALEATFSVGFGLYAAPAYLRRHGSPAGIDDLAGHRLIAFDHSMAHVAPKPWQQSGGRKATIVFRSSSPHARLAAVRAGLGLAMLPEPLVRDGAGLRRVLSSDAVGRLGLMMFVSAELRREPRVAAARDFLVELFSNREGTSGA
jgi:DNA-binding transcriptional LysR family regulator